MRTGIVFMLVASVWFVFRRRIAAYQVHLITEKLKAVPARDRAAQTRGMEDIGVLFCLLLFGAGALLDAAQVMNLPPASKYAVSSENVVLALAGLSRARPVAVRNLHVQFVFAWLTRNGDLHAQNVSVLSRPHGSWVVAPMYDIPCTLLYGDDTMAFTVNGRVKSLKAGHWREFADAIGLSQRAGAAANAVALAAASAIRLEELPFTGSPLKGALRELRFRRAELTA